VTAVEEVKVEPEVVQEMEHVILEKPKHVELPKAPTEEIVNPVVTQDQQNSGPAESFEKHFLPEYQRHARKAPLAPIREQKAMTPAKRYPYNWNATSPQNKDYKFF